MKGRKWILAKHFDGSPKEGDLRLVEFDVPSIKDGGKKLVNCVYLVSTWTSCNNRAEVCFVLIFSLILCNDYSSFFHL